MFPHEIVFQIEQQAISDGGGGLIEGEWVEYDRIQGFLDTPNSTELYQAEQLNHPFDRHLYFPYRTDIQPNMRIVCEGETYELTGKPLDQGGQHEIMRVDVRLIG